MSGCYVKKSKKNYIKRFYLSFMLWFVGRAIQASAKLDDEIKKEFDQMPNGFSFSLGCLPSGPNMVIEKGKDGIVRYLGSRKENGEISLKMSVKNMDVFFLLFSFQESTPVSNARCRLIVDGEIPFACSAVRILDIVQVYLLPKPIAKLAIKRYPRWSIMRHTWKRSWIYIRTITG